MLTAAIIFNALMARQKKAEEETAPKKVEPLTGEKLVNSELSPGVLVIVAVLVVCFRYG